MVNKKTKIKDNLKKIDKSRSYMGWLIKYSKPYIPKILFLLMLSVASSMVTLGLSVVSKRIVDSSTSGNFKGSILAVYAIMVLTTIAITAVNSLLSAVVDERFSFGIRKQLYEKIIHSHWMDVKRYHTGDLMTRLTSDAGNIANGIIYTIPDIIKLVLEIIMTFCLLYYYAPLLAVLSLCIAPVAGATCAWLGRRLKVLQVKVQESEAAYRSFLQESLANLLIVKAFANEEYSTNKLVELRENRFYWVLKKNRFGVASSMIISLTFQTAYITAFTIGAFQVSRGAITYGTMTLFISLVSRIQSPIIQLAQNIPKVVSILASAGRVMELQKMPEEEVLSYEEHPKQVGVEISDLTFGYVEEEKVLDQAELSIQPGEFVAIVGESGIGKTTLVRLMMSFMSNAKGSILFQGENGMTERANAGTREFISYVPQGNTLFSGTIRENVHMGRIDATEEEMIEALKMACAYDFVKDLPNGIDTVIGERGHGISEGQAQRVAIARSLVRKAPFLILDEATSSLDEKTELEVLESIRHMEPKPTCLLITHRRSVLDYCDREIKIQNKKLEEVNL